MSKRRSERFLVRDDISDDLKRRPIGPLVSKRDQRLQDTHNNIIGKFY